MNFWTGLILGLIIGWVIEWIIDWLFWRREAAPSSEQDALVQERLEMADNSVAQLDMEWQNRLAAAEQDYQAKLAAVEEEWQARLNLNEEQWQAQFAELEADNSELHTRLAAATAVTVGTAIAAGREDVAEPEMEATEIEPVIVAEWEDAAELEMEPVEVVELEGAAPDDIDELDARFETAAPLAASEVAVEDTGIGMALAGGMLAGALLDDVDEGPAMPEVAKGAADDLTRIHGIGPKYAGLLTENDIATFESLAAASPEHLREIINPGPMQQPNFESWIAQASAFSQSRSMQIGDDLTLLEGIGPVYASRLRDSGITSFAALAASDEATLAGIIDAPAWRRVEYGDWIDQARLAAAGDSAGLKLVQNRLFRREGENLQLIRGLGERSANALEAAGISTFTALAAASPQQLEAIIHNAGVRGDFDYEGWITEATLRASGRRITRERPAATHIVSCPQDLSAVSGIGAIYEDRLYAAGIGSYWELAETPASDLATILALQSYQEADLAAIKSSAMELAVRSNSIGRSWDGTPPDNFEELEGLGEIYERRLYEAGICTFDALAAATPDHLAEICQAPPMRRPNYDAWIAVATEKVAARRSG